jgi:hypothetical protein
MVDAVLWGGPFCGHEVTVGELLQELRLVEGRLGVNTEYRYRCSGRIVRQRYVFKLTRNAFAVDPYLKEER